MSELIRAGDSRSWLLCKRRVWYDHFPPAKTLPADAFGMLIMQAGYAHEDRVKKQLADKNGEVIEARNTEHTLELMAAKTPVIYQAVMVDEQDGLTGKPDFLILQNEGGYQVADAKLATNIKKRTDIKIQLSIYRSLLNSSSNGLVYLGTGEIAEVGPEADVKCQSFISGMQTLLASDQRPDASFGFTKCNACPYQQTCIPEFEQQEAISLLYDMREQTAKSLAGQGISTITALADASVSALEDAPYLKGEAKKQTAIWRAQSYLSGKVRQMQPIALPEGIWLHFDIEANPLSVNEDGPQVYLWGLLAPDYSDHHYHYYWSDGRKGQDYQAWCAFLDCLESYRLQSGKCVIAHYSNYERTQIKRYADRYDMKENGTVRWLLGKRSPLFDLQKVVKNSLVLPLKGYGLKAICKDERLVNFQWSLEESGSQWSVVRYLDFLDATDPDEQERIKQEILTYNRDDVKATRALELWLKEPGLKEPGLKGPGLDPMLSKKAAGQFG